MFKKLLSNPNLPLFVACAALALSIVSISVQAFLCYVSMVRQTTKAHDVTIKVEPPSPSTDVRDISDTDTVLSEEDEDEKTGEKKAEEEEVVVTEEAPTKEDHLRPNAAPITHVEYTPEGVPEEGVVLEGGPPFTDAPLVMDIE